MKTSKKIDYNKALERTKEMIHVYLGQEVRTPIGKGIVVSLKMGEWNGLYISPDDSKVVVWFGVSNSKDGWVNTEFRLSELKINDRQEKLKKINNNIKNSKV